MCRTGGRRCPSHINEDSIAHRNEVRREQYATDKLRESTAGSLASKGFTVHRGNDVQDAYFQGSDAYDPNKFTAVTDWERPVINNDQNDDGQWQQMANEHFYSKPFGGLWTAPGVVADDGTVKTGWTDLTHDGYMPVSDEPLVKLNVRKKAVIICINEEKDIERLYQEFPAKSGKGFSYEAMAAAGVDGVRLTKEGLSKAKAGTGEIRHLDIWDTDSTVWIRSDGFSAGKSAVKGYYEPLSDDDRNDYWDDDSIDDLIFGSGGGAKSSEQSLIDDSATKNTTDSHKEDELQRLRDLLTGNKNP